MTKTFFELKEELSILHESDDQTVLVHEPPNPFRPDARRMHTLRHTQKGTMAKLKKGMTDHEKKHMKGAYMDDTDIVHRATGKTMGRTMSFGHGKDGKGTKSKTFGVVRKEIQAYIAKHHPEKLKEELSILHESDDQTTHLKGGIYGLFSSRHSHKTMMNKLRQGMSYHERKHMDRAELDGPGGWEGRQVHIIHKDTGRTMSKMVDGGKSKTYGEVRKEIQAHIAKHHPEK